MYAYKIIKVLEGRSNRNSGYICAMTKNKAWLEAIRLRTLPLSLAGILMGSGIAFFNGFVDWIIFALAMITTILFQILSNLANDLGDGMKGTDNTERIGPMRAIQSGLISQKEMKLAVIFTGILSIISSAALIYVGTQNMPFETILFYGVLAVLCVIAAITYTIGKRAYGYNAMGDVMVFIFFGFVSVLGVYSLYSKQFDWLNLLPAIAIGLFSTAVLNLNNMRDYASDKNAGKNTLVVKIGPNFAKMYHVLIVFIAIGSHFYFLTFFKQPIVYLSLLPTIALLIHTQKVMKTKFAKDFDPELKKVALSTFAIAFIFFLLSNFFA